MPEKPNNLFYHTPIIISHDIVQKNFRICTVKYEINDIFTFILFRLLTKIPLPPHTMTFATLMICIEPHVSNLIRSITKDKYMGKNKYITLKSLNCFLCYIHMLKIYTLPHSYDKWSESGGEL